MVEKNLNGDTTVLTLRPNRSATWRQSKGFLLLMMTPMFIIAIGWSIIGAWPVLPFAGIEFLLLAYLTYRVSYLTYQKDSITIERERLTLQFDVGRKTGHQQVLLRPDTHLYVTRPKKPMDLPILRLGDQRRRLEVGHFLNEQDREALRSELVLAGLIECTDRWWEV